MLCQTLGLKTTTAGVTFLTLAMRAGVGVSSSFAFGVIRGSANWAITPPGEIEPTPRGWRFGIGHLVLAVSLAFVGAQKGEQPVNANVCINWLITAAMSRLAFTCSAKFRCDQV